MDESKALTVISLEEQVQRAAELAADALSENTRRAYKADFEHFTTWCHAQQLEPIGCPIQFIAAYLATMAEDGYKTASISRRLTAIGQAHELADLPNPAHDASVRKVMQGIRRKYGKKQEGVLPLMSEDILMMCDAIEGDDSRAARDRALLMIGFAGGFRRSELVGLHVDDLDFRKQGVVITIRKSKTDQEGEGRTFGIHRNHSSCPVDAIYNWLEIACIKSGPVFRPIDRHRNIKSTALTAQSVALVVKKYALLAGLDPKNYSGHSLRSGLATQAAQNGVSERIIMKTTGHKTTTMVRRYIKDGQMFEDNASKSLF